MHSNVYFGDELRLVRLIFDYPELRSQYQSLELHRFVSKPVSAIVAKILAVQYFKASAIDLNYVYEKCEVLGLDPIVFVDFRDQLSSIESRAIDFWNIVDEIKTRNLKASTIPVLLSEYEKLVRAESEIEVTSSISNINERMKAALGRQVITVNDQDDIRNIANRVKFYSGELDSPQKRWLTGYESIDSVMGGFASSELCVFMGAPGTGKTILLLNLAYSLWDFAKANIHFYSLEMPLVQVNRRLDARMFQIDSNLLRAGHVTDLNMDVVKDIESRPNSFLTFDFPPQSTVQDIEENFLKADVKPDILVIDYAGLLRTKAKGGSSIAEIADEVSMGLKYMSKRYKTSVITAAQVTTEATKKAGETQEQYNIYDVAGGAAFGRNADILCGIKFNENLNIMDFGSPKNRDGQKFSFQMFIDKPKCYMYEIR